MQLKEVKQVVIFDLDGCVFDDEWRLPKIDMSLSGEDRYKEYHLGIDADPVISHSLSMLRKAAELGATIVFMTARPQHCQGATKLKLHTLGIEYELMMREPGDDRPSPEVKCSMVYGLFEKIGPFRIFGAFDDREDVIQMYRLLGLNAWVLDTTGTDAPVINLTADGKLEYSEVFEINVTAGPDFKSSDVHAAMGPTQRQFVDSPKEPQQDAGDVLAAMGKTFKERNAIYGNNAEVTGRVMAAPRIRADLVPRSKSKAFGVWLINRTFISHLWI